MDEFIDQNYEQFGIFSPQEQLEELLERKEQLKLQLRESREECSQWEQKHK